MFLHFPRFPFRLQGGVAEYAAEGSSMGEGIRFLYVFDVSLGVFPLVFCGFLAHVPKQIPPSGRWKGRSLGGFQLEISRPQSCSNWMVANAESFWRNSLFCQINLRASRNNRTHVKQWQGEHNDNNNKNQEKLPKKNNQICHNLHSNSDVERLNHQPYQFWSPELATGTHDNRNKPWKPIRRSHSFYVKH